MVNSAVAFEVLPVPLPPLSVQNSKATVAPETEVTLTTRQLLSKAFWLTRSAPAVRAVAVCAATGPAAASQQAAATAWNLKGCRYFISAPVE